MRTHPLGIALTTLVAPVLWGTTYVTVTELLPPDRPLQVAALRVLPAGALLALLAWWRGRWRPRGIEWRRLAVRSTFTFALFFPLLILAAYRLPGGVAAAFGGTQPLLVAAIGAIVLGRRPGGREITVGVVAFVGVALVVLRPGAVFDAVGVAAALGANAAFAVGVVLAKRDGADANPVGVTGWQMLIASAVLVPLALLVEGQPAMPTAINSVGFLYLGLVATGLAFLAWFYGVPRLPAAAPPLLGLAAPVTGAILGWALLAQDLGPTQLLGFAITIAAIAHGALSSRAGAPTDASAVPQSEGGRHSVRGGCSTAIRASNGSTTGPARRCSPDSASSPAPSP